ncbi:MAG: transglutaminase domain-containing protein [Spirochaetia bacterium]
MKYTHFVFSVLILVLFILLFSACPTNPPIITVSFFDGYESHSVSNGTNVQSAFLGGYLTITAPDAQSLELYITENEEELELTESLVTELAEGLTEITIRRYFEPGETYGYSVVHSEQGSHTGYTSFSIQAPEVTDSTALQSVLPQVTDQYAQGGLVEYLSTNQVGSYVQSENFVNDNFAENDVSFYSPEYIHASVNYYMHVSGAVYPDDYYDPNSPETQRKYHGITFYLKEVDTNLEDFDSANTYYITLPVDEHGYFSGYLYFLNNNQNYRVGTFRSWNTELYPHQAPTQGITVDQGWSNTYFYVSTIDGIAETDRYLLPSITVDVGTNTIADALDSLLSSYASRNSTTVSSLTDFQKIDAVYEWMVSESVGVNMDYAGDGSITSYDGIIENWSFSENDGWTNSTFIASDLIHTHQGVCNDFAELFAAFTRYMGFDVWLVRGKNSSNFGHMWNEISIPDSTGIDSSQVQSDDIYRVDTTWAIDSIDRELLTYSESKRFAEFYTQFDDEGEDGFTETHENTFNAGDGEPERYY